MGRNLWLTRQITMRGSVLLFSLHATPACFLDRSALHTQQEVLCVQLALAKVCVGCIMAFVSVCAMPADYFQSLNASNVRSGDSQLLVATATCAPQCCQCGDGSTVRRSCHPTIAYHCFAAMLLPGVLNIDHGAAHCIASKGLPDV